MNSVPVGFFVRTPVKTRGFEVAEIEKTHQNAKQHPQKDLIIWTDRVVSDYLLTVRSDAFADAGELIFADRRHLNSLTRGQAQC